MSEHEITPVVRRVLGIIRERGWSIYFSSGPGPLNLRSAMSIAVTEHTGGRNDAWHSTYRLVAACVETVLGEGILSWEGTGKHKQSEVEQKLTDLIIRLENYEDEPGNPHRTPGGRVPGIPS